MTQTIRIDSAISGTVTASLDSGSGAYTLDRDASITLAEGTANGESNLAFRDTRTLTASATETLDLSGTLENGLGQAQVFVEVTAIKVSAAAGNTNNVVVGGGSNPFIGPFADTTDKLTLKPGASVLLVCDGAGWAVTAGTGDLILVANSAGSTSVTYTITIIGRSA